MCTRKFKDFIEAIKFVASTDRDSTWQRSHHPDIEISNNRVTIKLTTRDAGGLTEKDLTLFAANFPDGVSDRISLARKTNQTVNSVTQLKIN